MKCSECQKDGKKSKVFESGGGTSTLAYYAPFYDEEGKYHNHDGNTSTHGFKCSNGHEWNTISTGSYWCGWPNKTETAG